MIYSQKIQGVRTRIFEDADSEVRTDIVLHSSPRVDKITRYLPVSLLVRFRNVQIEVG